MALANTAWNQVITSTFWCRFCQHWCFNIDKFQVIKIITDGVSYLCTELKVFQHLWTTKIQVAVTHTCIITSLNTIFDFKWCCFGSIKDFKVFNFKFDSTCRQVIISLFTRFNSSCYFNNKFATQTFSCFNNISVRIFRVNNQLHQTFTVTKIDENQTSKVTTARYPTFQSNSSSDVFTTNTSGIHRTFHKYTSFVNFLVLTIIAKSPSKPHPFQVRILIDFLFYKTICQIVSTNH